MGVIYKNGTYYGGGGSGGAEITIDNELSSTSENPVQNKVIKTELDNKQDADDLMIIADMDDVVTPLPGVASRLPRYSTEEQIVGYWIDGKPLYQKTVNFGALPDNTTKTVDHNISDIDHIWLTGGFAEQQNNGFTNLLNLSSSTNSWYFGVNKTYIHCQTTSNRTNYTSYVTLQYTKTTD